MECSIQQVARIAGTTSRTLRHYDEIGLLPPSRIGSNGYRHYDERALVKLQRVLLLRELGLSLPRIADVLAREIDEVSALTTHLSVLEQERDRLARQIAAVGHTIESLREKETLMAENMFDGFNHARYNGEVEERWGADAFARSDAWWRGMTEKEQASWLAQVSELNREWIAAATDPEIAADSPQAQDLAERHVSWLRSVPGAPASDPDGDLHSYVRGLADMYVSDERFAANYGGVEGAAFVREALSVYLT